MQQEEQQFLNNLDKRLWTAANKLLPMSSIRDALLPQLLSGELRVSTVEEAVA